MSHAVLLGDSIFDNQVYVPGQPDVVRQLRKALGEGWQATLLAVDGSTVSGVTRQIDRLPFGATHLVISAGGNDALGASFLLGQSVRTVGEAVAMLEQAQRSFSEDYMAMLEPVLAKGLPTAICTIYDTPPSQPDQPIIRAGLSLFNDIITRVAFSRGLPLIDLRLICNEDADYANPIEPSVQGGEKIARAIASLFTEKNGNRRSMVVAESA